MKLSRIILFLFITGSAIYIAAYILWGVLHGINWALDFTFKPEW